MSGKLRLSVLVLSLLCAVTAPAANAQSAMLQAKVSFSFLVGDIEFPAGDYTIRSTGSSTPGTLVIMNTKTHLSKMFNTSQVSGEDNETKGRLLFHTIHGKQHRSQVCFEGRTSGRELLATKVVTVGDGGGA